MNGNNKQDSINPGSEDVNDNNTESEAETYVEADVEAETETKTNKMPFTFNTGNQNQSNLVPIDIGDIMWNAVLNNKVIILSIIPLFAGYYLQDTIFTRSIAKVTSDIPGFVENIDTKKVLMVLLPYIVAVILFYVSNVISAKTISKIEYDAVNELTGKLIESIQTSKKTINVSDLMTHIKKLSDTKNIYGITVTYIIPTIIVAISLIYNFTRIDGKYGIIVILIIIVMMLVTTKLEFDSIDNAYKTEESSNKLYDEIHEIMTNIDTVITSDTKDVEMKNVDIIGTKTYELSCVSELNNSNTTYGLQSLSIVSMLGINYMSYKLYAQGLIDGSTFTSTVLLSLLFMDYYNYCIHAIGDLITSMGKYSETREYFNNFMIDTTGQKEKDNMITLRVTRGDIVFKNITLRYENKLVFDQFNLKIRGGTVNGLLGPIGSGKTTMLKMLAGIIGYEGEILIDDQNFRNCTYESIVEHIAYIPQHPKLFNRTIYYNINYASSYSKKELTEKLNALGLGAFIDSFPKKLDTIVGKEGSKLSGGQRQFVSLIRAIIQNKTILLLDEPSSSLDSTNKKIFMDLIKNIKNKTIIISTHDRQVMPLFDRVINIGARQSNVMGKEKGNGQNDQKSSKSDFINAYNQNQYRVKYY